MNIQKCNKLVSTLPHGAGLGVACQFGFPNAPTDHNVMNLAVSIIREILKRTFSDIDFKGKRGRLLPNGPTINGIGFRATAGYPLLGKKDPIQDAFSFAKDFIEVIDSLPPQVRSTLGTVAAILSVDLIYSFEASPLASTFLTGLDIAHAESQTLRQVFMDAGNMTKQDRPSSLIVATEGFWDKIKESGSRFQRFDPGKVKNMRSLCPLTKEIPLYLLDLTPPFLGNVACLRKAG